MGRTHRTTTRCWNHYRVQRNHTGFSLLCRKGNNPSLCRFAPVHRLSSRRSPTMVQRRCHRSKELKKNNRICFDYYQYLDVPVFTDRYWILRGFFETKTDATNRTTKIFHWENISHKYPEFQKKVQTKNPYALEPLINVGAWIFENWMTRDCYRCPIIFVPIRVVLFLWHCSPSLPKIPFQTTSKTF